MHQQKEDENENIHKIFDSSRPTISLSLHYIIIVKGEKEQENSVKFS